MPAEVLRRLVEAVGVLRELEPAAGELDEALEEAAAVCREADGREEAVLGILRRAPRIGRLAGLLPGETPAQMAVFTGMVRDLAGELDGDEPALEVVSRALERVYARDAPEAAGPGDEAGPEARARARLREAGRNDPCPCGSGQKYKDCHWVEDVRTTRV